MILSFFQDRTDVIAVIYKRLLLTMPSFEKALAAKAASESNPSPPPEGAVANPFADMDIVDYSFLDSVSDRSVCPLCSKRRKFFCYGCYCSMPDIASKVPSVSLPIKLHVVKHPKEVEGEHGTAQSVVILMPRGIPGEFPRYNYS